MSWQAEQISVSRQKSSRIGCGLMVSDEVLVLGYLANDAAKEYRLLFPRNRHAA